MNILLIYPKYPDTYWSFKHILWFISCKAAYPPLGLLTIASMLPEEWNKKLVDINVCKLKDKDIEWADMVFISAMLVQKTSAQDIIDRCKAKGKIIVAGGPAFTTQPEIFHNVDHYILNEAEVTLPLFLDDLTNNRLKPLYSSTIYPDIEKSPVPMWSLIRFKDYATMTIQYSRGCPFNCEFCDIIILNGRKPRCKSPQQILNEFQSLYEAGWRDTVFIVDDNFIGNNINVKIMLPELIAWQKNHKYPFKLLSEASINLVDDEELMKMMREANFYKIFLGLETPNVDSLTECGKIQNKSRDLVESVRIIHHNGMQVMAGFIVGFDNDKESIFDMQIKFIQKTGVVAAMVGILTALPKTQLWNRLKKEGRLLSEASGENTDASLNFVPTMDKKILQDGYKYILSTIYSPKEYYSRMKTFIKDYQPSAKGKLAFRDIKALIRSMWRIGFLSPSCFRYWKIMISTCLSKIRALPIIVEMAIIGLHFDKVTQRCIKSEEK